MYIIPIIYCILNYFNPSSLTTNFHTLRRRTRSVEPQVCATVYVRVVVRKITYLLCVKVQKSLLARRNAIYQSQFIQQQKHVRQQHYRLTDIDVVYPEVWHLDRVSHY